MFFRSLPFGGGYAVFAGLETFLDRLKAFRFSDEDIAYLRSRGCFRESFLEYLKNFSFKGDVYSVKEGSVVFPQEPLMRIEASLIEAQVIESMLLNQINFQTLIATKTSRMFLSSRNGKIMEFGMRRAQGIDGAMSASRAAFIGGAWATSNTLGASLFDIPAVGTMAHSWVMSFNSELEAFRHYAEIYPENTILLIDTYDTLGSGIENAITVGLELKEKGRNMGVRLDSGDLCYLSKEVRKRLDDAGLNDATIVVSNELDEFIISQLLSEGAPIDSWGVGTRMVTGGKDSALTGVYKLAARQQGDTMIPVMKISNNPVKSSTPGIKQVYRFYDENGRMLRDMISLKDEASPEKGPLTFHHPMYQYKKFTLDSFSSARALIDKVMDCGEICAPAESLKDVQDRCIREISQLDESYTRLLNPHVYKISLSEKLKDMKFDLIRRNS
jgi:nicotinate phosphoribosyltransferase